jgi:transposase
MWTAANRENYSRKTTRYQSDVTDEEWRIIGPLLPRPRTTGRPRAWPLREIVNGIFYVMRSGCTWRQLPTDLPPWSTVYRWFAAWRDICLFERINHALVIADRERMGRQASPSAAIIDSQSVNRVAMTPAKRSKVESATRSSIPMGAASCSNRILRVSRIATAVDRFCKPPAVSSPSLTESSPMGDMPAGVLPPQSPSSLRSSISILFCRADGLLSVSSLGSGAIGDSQRILRPQSPPPGRSSTPHPSCCFHVAWRGQYEFRNRLLARLF